MRLLIISHTPHYRRDKSVVGWGPTVREIDHLANLFEEVVHIAPLYSESAPDSALPYHSDRVALRSISPSGGTGLIAKLGILTTLPSFVRALRRELRSADVVHVRCPANISLVAIMLLAATRRPAHRWMKYAGNWRPNGREPWSYRIQRWWLERGWHRGVVTVNGRWPGQPRHVHSFLNPCLTDQELLEARVRSSGKVMGSPVRLVFVGQLTEAKGVGHAIEVLAAVRRNGVDAVLDLVGDSPQRAAFEEMAAVHHVREFTHFHGWQPRVALDRYYSAAHLMLFPTESEGWPKVLSEAMAYRVVPLSTAVSSIPQYLQDFRTGRTFPSGDVKGYVEAILWYTAHPEDWAKEADNAMCAAEMFTYTAYLEAVDRLLADGEAVKMVIE